MYLFILFIIPLVVGGKHDCPGSTFQCDDSSTCCQLLDKSYGCCPLINAMCCDDHIHCCPTNTKCSNGMCIQQDALMNSTAYVIKSQNINDVTCPGGESICPDDATCCATILPGFYTCCSYKDAVCCSDKQHCCPSHTTCNLEHETCDGDNFALQMYDSSKKLYRSHSLPTLKVTSEDLSSVICPGSSFQCPDGYTCCKLQSGNWGCCPFPEATCCKDGLHCCPKDMMCDSTSSFCTQGRDNVTSVRNVPATAVKKENIVCPDKSECQGSMTCCPISDKKYGCCQYPNASCCSDKSHCCPSGNTCDVVEKRCIPKGHWLLNSIS